MGSEEALYGVWGGELHEVVAVLASRLGCWLRLPELVLEQNVAVMKVLRERGIALSGVREMVESLKSRGISGTRAELEILADRLKDVGVATLIEVESGLPRSGIPPSAWGPKRSPRLGRCE